MYGSEFYDQIGSNMANGPFWAFIGAFIALAIIVSIGIYVYWAFAWYTILGKLKYKKAWLAWIPIAQIVPILEVGGFHWAWVFLLLIPILGWLALYILVIIATWRIFEKRKYPGWLSLSMIVPKVGGLIYLIVIGFVAWKDHKKR